jgi:gluconolactonase
MASAIPGNPTFRTLAAIAHGEAVALGPEGMLWTGDEQGRIWRIDPANGSFAQVAQVDGWAVGLCLDADGRAYVCVYGGAGAIVRVDPATGATEVYTDRVDGTPLATPNWPAFAPDGTLCVSDNGSEDLDECDGRLVRIPPGGGEGEVVPTRPLHFPNGLAFAPDGTLYMIESFSSRVVAVRDDRLEPYAELPGTIPDGLALDREGGLLVACFQPNRVLRIPPGGGEPEILLDDWTGQRMLTPTNVAFYGPDMRDLAIASLCGWRISTVKLPIAGQPLFYPRVPG